MLVFGRQIISDNLVMFTMDQHQQAWLNPFPSKCNMGIFSEEWNYTSCNAMWNIENENKNFFFYSLNLLEHKKRLNFYIETVKRVILQDCKERKFISQIYTPRFWSIINVMQSLHCLRLHQSVFRYIPSFPYNKTLISLISNTSNHFMYNV